MFIISTVKNAIVNATTATTDTIRGTGTIIIDNLCDNRLTDAVKTAKNVGKSNREQKKAERLAKKLIKLQEKQAEMTFQQSNKSDF